MTVNVAGAEQCLGFMFHTPQHGAFEPTAGKLEVTAEEADAHNKALSKALIDGLDRCEVGQQGTFYYVNGQVRTWVGDVVSTSITHTGSSITFTRNGKAFRGRLQKDADSFHFKRIS